MWNFDEKDLLEEEIIEKITKIYNQDDFSIKNVSKIFWCEERLHNIPVILQS